MKLPRLPVLAVALLLLAAAPAWAVSRVDGGLFVTFSGGIYPTALPRSAPAPVAVGVAGTFKSAAGDAAIPQLRQITVAINRQGRIFDRGLPVCRVWQVQPATSIDARRVCKGAIVGSGHVTVQVRIPEQTPFTVPAKLVAFNGPRSNGHKQILAQVYVTQPPGSFVLTFTASTHDGTFGTVLSTTLPQATVGWAYVTHFDMTLQRTYSYRGRSRSFVSAACSAPAGFTTAVFPFARATYGFANGQHLSVSQNSVCRVR